MTPEVISSIKPEVYLGQFFHSRDVVHLAHLQTTSYAEHKALNEYYDGLLDLLDSMIESYFGCIGKRINIKIPASDYINPETHLKQFKDYVKKHRGVLGTDRTDVQNILDEIIALINKTLYLLTLS
jgi:hypothetical protein